MLTMLRRVAHHLLREAGRLAGRADQNVPLVSIDNSGEVPAILDRQS